MFLISVVSLQLFHKMNCVNIVTAVLPNLTLYSKLQPNKGLYYATQAELNLYSIQRLLKIYHKQSIDIDLNDIKTIYIYIYI